MQRVPRLGARALGARSSKGSWASQPLSSSAPQLRSLSAIHPARQQLKNAKRCLVKVGTAVVSDKNGMLALSRMGGLVEQIKELREQGREVILISSGAVGLGRRRLGLRKEDIADVRNIVERQACAAAGQEALMSTYDIMFTAMGLKCAQVLITQQDFFHSTDYEYLTKTMERLTKAGIVPIVNENDVVTGAAQVDKHAFKCFSDNDMLSALVSGGSKCDGVAMMTDVEAVYTKPPDQPGAERISVFDPEMGVEIGAKSAFGRGGMASKIEAAQVAANGGATCAIANGMYLENISRVFNGEDIGTVFPAEERPTRLQHWLAHAANCEGSIVVKSDAYSRLVQDSAHVEALEAMDIKKIEGHWDQDSPVIIKDEEGHELGRAVVHLDDHQLEQFVEADKKGQLSEEKAHLHIVEPEELAVTHPQHPNTPTP